MPYIYCVAYLPKNAKRHLQLVIEMEDNSFVRIKAQQVENINVIKKQLDKIRNYAKKELKDYKETNSNEVKFIPQ